MPNIMTELEFRNQTELSEEIISSWVQSNVIRPLEVNGGKYFLPKHIRLATGIRELESRNVEQEVIFGHIQNEVLDVETVLNTMDVNHRNLEYYQGLPFEELVELARTERVTGFRTMTREELEICLSSPAERADIIAAVRERNRLARAEARANANVQSNEPVETSSNEETATPENDYSQMSYKDLVILARENAIPNFRRMTKEELIIVNFGTAEEIDAVIIDVRERTRNRYGAGSQNLEVDQMDLGEFFEELDGIVEDPDFYEEPFVTVEEEFEEDEIVPSEITVEPTVEEATPITFVEPTVEETVTEATAEVAENNIEEPQVFVMPEGDWVTDEVPFTFAQLQALNSKQLAVVVRDHCPVKYFRRMTKDELLICIFQPERRSEMSANALLRYERYRGNRYGSNR